jgi:hypothetical protein
MHGTTQTMGISSNPSSAAVWIDRQYVGETPVTVSLKRNQNHYIQIELQGYQPYEIVCTRQMSGWVFGNIVFGGVIGLCVDAISGGIYRLTPEQVNAEMHLNRIAYSKHNDASYFAIVLQPDPTWEKIGQMQKQ